MENILPDTLTPNIVSQASNFLGEIDEPVLILLAILLAFIVFEVVLGLFVDIKDNE